MHPGFEAGWELKPTWREDEQQADLRRRRELENRFYPIMEAASAEYRRHADFTLASGDRRGAGKARSYIPSVTLGTPGDPYIRDQPALKYLNQSIALFLTNYYQKELQVSQVNMFFRLKTFFLKKINCF